MAGSPGWSESASVAHIYGQNLVAAESLTAIGDSFAFAPEN
ncbi:MAG TPA: glycosyl hydrolase [Blastocatellia bacterium]|nr:glycosyl hydrolase [Blastocatellia bacterium]